MKRYLIILFVAALAALSCTKEEPIGQGSGSDGKVQFTITVPGSGIPTRGEVIQGSDADTRIDNLLLLLFDNKNNKYVGHTIPTQIERGGESSAGAYLVTAELPVNGEYLVVAIANWRGTNSEVETAVAKIEADNNLLNKDNPKTFNDVVPLFDYPHYANLPDQNKGFVMSGSNVFVFTQINRPEIELKRTVAKLNITVAKTAPNDELVNSELGITQFHIEEVHIQNIKANVRPITMNDNSLYIAAGNPYPTYKYTIDAKDNRSVKDQIFLSETAYNPDAAITARINVLIKANLGTKWGSRWFRLDINDQNVEGTFAGIVRNNRYEMTITGVNNIGYELKAEAEGAPTNVVSTISAREDANTQYDHVVWNGTTYLAATSVPEFEPWEFANGTEQEADDQRYKLGYLLEIRSNIKADYNSPKYQIQIESYPEWLGGIKPSDNNRNVAMIEIAPLSRNDGVNAERREGVVVIKAGPMTLKIPVVQKAGGILAPPGVPGVGVKSGRLTLRGSKEFKNQSGSSFADFATKNFGGLTDETVYVAYFKHGSLIATSSAGIGEEEFDPEKDVVWRPEQFRGNIASWNDIPTGPAGNGVWPATDDPAKGTGDPCRLADGSKGKWRVPTGVYNADPSAAYWGSQKLNEFSTNNDDDIRGVYIAPNIANYFSPDTRRRDENGQMTKYPILSNPSLGRGYYWVSEAKYMQVQISPEKATQGVSASSAAAIRCVYTPPAANIIYWDATSQTMQLGNWKVGDGGVVTQENMLFFQFGSTIGFTAGYDSWDKNDIKFNLSSDTDYASLHNWWNWLTAGAGSVMYENKHLADGYISTPAYHDYANVKEGRGDPCKLVGLTKAQILDGEIDNGLWVMPTLAQQQAEEWEVYTGYGPYPTTYTENTPAGARNKAGQFLPAAGGRNTNSGPGKIGLEGRYWASKPGSALDGSRLMFLNSGVDASGINEARLGLGVRCVPAPPAPPAPAEPYILYMASDGKLSVGQWGDDVNAQNILFTQYGGTIASYSPGTTNGSTFKPNKIAFNPTGTTFTSTAWVNLPHASTTSQPPLPNNISKGQGDICRLVGMTAAEVRSMSEGELATKTQNSEFRLPTGTENRRYVENMMSPKWTALGGINGLSYRTAATGSALLFLPAMGRILPDDDKSSYITEGQLESYGTAGFWWSSDFSITMGTGMNIHSDLTIDSNTTSYRKTGRTVRCVRR